MSVKNARPPKRGGLACEYELAGSGGGSATGNWRSGKWEIGTGQGGARRSDFSTECAEEGAHFFVYLRGVGEGVGDF